MALRKAFPACSIFGIEQGIRRRKKKKKKNSDRRQAVERLAAKGRAVPARKDERESCEVGLPHPAAAARLLTLSRKANHPPVNPTILL